MNEKSFYQRLGGYDGPAVSTIVAWPRPRL